MSHPEPIDDFQSVGHVSRRRAHSPARRALARRERRARKQARVDLALGVALALLVVLIAPGLAIVALGVAVALIGCLVSWLVQRRRSRLHPHKAPETHP